MDHVIRRRTNISTAISILCLLFLLVAIIPCFSKEGERVDISNIDPTGMYDIDYRGPETHSHVPPPNKGHRHHHQHHDHDHGQRVMVLPRRSQGLGTKKVHG